MTKRYEKAASRLSRVEVLVKPMRLRKRVSVSPGESVRIIRELQGLIQVQLAELCGIPRTTTSSIENSRVNLGVERAKALAFALRCHPAVLVFPGWQVSQAPAA